VKTPISPNTSDRWKFNIEKSGLSIKEKMDGDPQMHILVDISYMTKKDLLDLQDWLLIKLPEDQLDKIEFVKVASPFKN